MHFDLVIVGTGSGNTIMGKEYEHLTIAIVESGRFGGTCLNVGCIPTKMYVYPADVAEAARNAGRLGVHATIDSSTGQASGTGSSPGSTRYRTVVWSIARVRSGRTSRCCAAPAGSPDTRPWPLTCSTAARSTS